MSPDPAPGEIAAFLAPGADRIGVLEGLLGARGCSPRRVRLAGSEHLVAGFQGAADPAFRRLVLVAHYDRAAGTPGALDNSAACLQLVALAGRTAARGGDPGLVVIFTDAEERAAAGAESQGSFALGRALAALGGRSPAVFAFDVTGRGDVPIVSESPGELLGRGGLGAGRQGRGFSVLRDAAFAAARDASGGKALRLGLPWSDDLGFTLGGLPAVALTLLPAAEAAALERALRDADATAAGGEGRAGDRRRGGDAGGGHGRLRDALGAAWPATWDLIHTPRDAAGLLEPGAFALMGRILDAIAALRLPARP